MLKKIVLPDQGEGIDSADVSEILIKPGDTVSVDDIISVSYTHLTLPTMFEV